MLTPLKKKYRFSPELAALIESQMAQGRVASSDATKVNREVGRIVGAKPFTLEHPFAVKASVLEKPGPGSINYRLRGNSLNLFSNEEVPGARFSTPYELGLDMPFDFTRTQKNLVYPIFNYENLNK